MKATVLDSAKWLPGVDVKATTLNVTLETSLKDAVKEGTFIFKSWCLHKKKRTTRDHLSLSSFWASIKCM